MNLKNKNETKYKYEISSVVFLAFLILARFDGKGFKDGIRVFIPQNMDSRTVCYQTEGGWVLHRNVAKKEEVSFFVVSPDGKELTCLDGSNIFSSVDKSDLLESFNMRFKTNCVSIERPNVFE